jgi:ssDNA-binding Zn-finger/Zn-ribbon topoisomerase 1
MHIMTMAESEGTFTKTEKTYRPCRECGAEMTCRVWESSCGGYEDYEYTCTNGHVEWVDGPDA